MCEQTEIDYLDGDVVWVKLGSCWWPGEVVGSGSLPPDVMPSFRKPPIAVVKFFQESTYEYVKNINSIYKYNCSRKIEFINKGLDMYRTKPHMEKFPEDVIRAETAVGGDKEILTREEFQEKKKESYAGLFGDTPKKTPGSTKRGGRGRPTSVSPKISTPVRKFKMEKSDYKVHILLQGSKELEQKSKDNVSTPSTSRAGSDAAEEKHQKVVEENKVLDDKLSTVFTPTVSTPGLFSCHSCNFSTTRLNVLILHNKTHSATFTPYTPSPVRKRPAKSPTKATPKSSKKPKTPQPLKEKTVKVKKSSAKKRTADEKLSDAAVKKLKTDQEIKSSLLADWDDDVDGADSNDDAATLVMSGSPGVPVGTESPAVPTPAELPAVPAPAELPSPQFPAELLSLNKKSDITSSTEKPESSSDSKYEFCEDEEWHVEADAGRKIPRVKNPSKRKEETKSLSIDDDDMAKEVAELLNKTVVPELPSIPEPLKAEENFPEPPVVKSPDKKPAHTLEQGSSEKAPGEKPTKAIFKTKTFFRSRHSRSQDAIGKYVAEQLNAAERMDMSESEINGSEAVSSPEARDSPPIEHIKVARLAPKIQLKKMKAEAALQLREKEKCGFDVIGDNSTSLKAIDTKSEGIVTTNLNTGQTDDKTEKLIISQSLQDVLYPTQEIKPINKESPDKLLQREVKPLQNEGRSHSKEKTFFPLEVNVKDEELFDNAADVLDSGFYKTSDETDKLHTIDKPETVKQTLTENLLENSNKTEDLSSRLSVVTSCPVENFYEPITQNSDMKTIQITSSLDSVAKKSLDKLNPQKARHTKQPTETGSQDIKKADTTSPQKIQNQQSEISSSVEFSPKKPVDHILSLTKKLNEANPHKSFEQSKEISSSTAKVAEPTIPKSHEPYMSESTASAVDALLSVSRETDRVPRIVTDDPPEDLFEDDNKDSSANNEFDISTGNGICDDLKMEPEITSTDEKEHNDLISIVKTEVSDNIVKEDIMPEGKSLPMREDDTLSGSESISITMSKAENIDNEGDVVTETLTEKIPSESDLQIAQTLLNLPSMPIPNNTPAKETAEPQENIIIPMCQDNEHFEEEIVTATEEVFEEHIKMLDTKEHDVVVECQVPSESLVVQNNDNVIRYETEQEKSENLNAAQSLVQMSESVDHKVNAVEANELNKDLLDVDIFKVKPKNGIDASNPVEQKTSLLSNENNTDSANGKCTKFQTTSSKLLKMLEEPPALKPPVIKSHMKHIIIPGKEKILNFDVAKSPLKAKPQTSKQKIIIRRAPSNKTIINNLNDIVASPDQIILSRSKQAQDCSSVQTFTIQASPETHTSSDAKQIIIQPKIRKIARPAKLQKIKPHNSLITPLNEPKMLNQTTSSAETLFDINSMPVVLSDDILTAESIEKMPIVMSDGNIIANTSNASANPPKLVKTKPTIIENEKITVSSAPKPNKPEVKTLLMTTASDVAKVTPNILSKSSKLRGSPKPMLVIDKATGKQKIIMSKAEHIVKEIKSAPSLVQSPLHNTPKTEKFIILPTASSPRPGRAQKIVIDPQTGKAHVLVAKGHDAPLGVPDNKPVSAKLLPSPADTNTPSNTVMIITNAQGAQSRIVLTPEHEKILFPNKQQPNVSQLKSITHRISTNTGITPKTIVTAAAPLKTQARIVPKQKSTIITSKGQLIVGGRIATTAQNIAPMPEIRPAPKRIVTTEPKKVVHAVQKNSTEPLIFLQQKSGTVMQLTAAQFQHLQRTGQIVQKAPAPAATAAVTPAPDNKIVIQKSVTLPKETVVHTVQKQRVRKTATVTSAPAKKLKQEIHITPAAAVSAPVPPLTALSSSAPPPASTLSSIVPSASNTVSVATTPSYSELENFEELLPSTAIARQIQQTVVAPPPEPAPVAQIALGAPQVEPQPELEPEPIAQLSDHLLAIPGESLGGLPGSFYLCFQDNGAYIPIDNRPLVLENNQLVPMVVEPAPVFCPQPERRDILEAALANSDVFQPDPPRDDAPDFRDLNANVSVHCRVSETSTTLHQPIMTPIEVPSNGEPERTVPSNLEDGLAVIGVTPHTVPTSLELPITVTDPRLAKPVEPMSHFGALLSSPGAELRFAAGEGVGGISMPLLTEEEAGGSGGKSMPILTDEVTASSAGSTGSPCSLEPREAEADDWPGARRRRLHTPGTPGSDTSEASAEIPLQPHIQLSVAELARHS